MVEVEGLTAASLRSSWRGYVEPIASGLLVTAAGLVPWTILARLNARFCPDLPWAAGATLLYIFVLLWWLHGAGPPRRTAARRRERLRLWPVAAANDGDVDQLPTGFIVGLLLLLSVLWVLVGRLSPVPDLSPYPTTSYRWSMFLMGGLLAGVVEEAAFRGYMQTGLERHDPDSAIWITSVVFVAAHLTHGVSAVLLLGPGILAASVLYGLLARRTGTIVPGIAIHALGDLAHVFFGLLRGDSSLLFVG